MSEQCPRLSENRFLEFVPKHRHAICQKKDNFHMISKKIFSSKFPKKMRKNPKKSMSESFRTLSDIDISEIFLPNFEEILFSRSYQNYLSFDISHAYVCAETRNIYFSDNLGHCSDNGENYEICYF
jgi:hypothetical protein